MPGAEVTGVVVKETAKAAATTAATTAVEGAKSAVTTTAESAVQTAASTASEVKPPSFDASNIRKLLGQPDMKPQQGLEIIADGGARPSTEGTNTPIPTPDNPTIINAPDANGEVTVTGPKLDTDPTNQPVSSEQNAGSANTDTAGQTEPGKHDTTPGRFAQLKNAVTSKFSYKPLNTPQIDNLDLRRPQDTTQTEASTSTQPAAEGATDMSAALKPPPAETQTPELNATQRPGAESTTADQMKEEFINDAPVKEPTAAERAGDPKTETEGKAEAEKSMRTRRDEVVAQLIKNNPDINVGDPKVQEMLDEAEGDPAKMEQTEKVLEIVNQKTQESADLVKTLGLPKELVGQLAKGELKSLINVLQEAAKALDADAAKKDAEETKNMHWLIQLLLVLAAASIAVPAGVVALGVGQLEGQTK